MTDEFNPRIAIIGAGPVGLEAALYARYLGYKVAVYEKGAVAERIRSCQQPLESPASRLASNLGRAALQAQDESFVFPNDDSRLTGQQFADGYLIHLSDSDLLAGCVHEHTEVAKIIRPVTGPDGGAASFQLSLNCPDGTSRSVEADLVIDASGAEIDGTLPAEAASDASTCYCRCSDADLYLLGCRAIGKSDFLLSDGHQQIRQLFSAIADRSDLDLYETVRHLIA